MIERYSLPPMRELWAEEARFRRWIEVEGAVARAQGELGLIPEEAAQAIVEGLKQVDIPRLISQAKEIEAEIGHDVLSFVRALEEVLGDAGRYVHFGLTSYDVVDTARSMAMRDALDLLISALDELRGVVLRRAREHKLSPMVGRTHGVHAEPITLGLKFLLWYAELSRNRERLLSAKETISVGKISGSVGTYAHLTPEVERRVCDLLGLTPAPVSNQSLQRDRHAQVLTALAILGGTLEKMATEVRNLHRTEIGELREGRPHGSSSMPHKRNPSTCETVSGLARLLRTNALAALENMAVWHEQDLSRSSVERVVIPDSFLACHFMLRRMTEVMENLVVDEGRMQKNLELTRGAVYSQALMLALVARGMSRREAHELVGRLAMAAQRGEGTLRELALGDPECSRFLPREEILRITEPGYFLRWVEEIFARFSE
jgi:adenylosuccinate lyase